MNSAWTEIEMLDVTPTATRSESLLIQTNPVFYSFPASCQSLSSSITRNQTVAYGYRKKQKKPQKDIWFSLLTLRNNKHTSIYSFMLIFICSEYVCVYRLSVPQVVQIKGGTNKQASDWLNNQGTALMALWCTQNISDIATPVGRNATRQGETDG